VVAYSLPKRGRVSREELEAHLHSDPERPDILPYRFKFYERDWGLCISEGERRELTGDWFDVEIDAELVEGNMHVGEFVVEGERPECLLFAAHIDHPMQVNDGLLGAAVLVELARLLAQRRDRLTWSYRFLFVPERIGTIAWIARFPERLPEILGGAFCEMPGVAGQALSLQATKWGDTKTDRVLAKLLRELDPDPPIVPCWKHVVNDEGFLNAPRVDVPIASVSRSAPGSPFEHFPEYHTDRDTPERVDWDGTAETLGVLNSFCEIVDADRVPVPQYVGDPFLSKHGLWVDWRENPALNVALEDIFHAVDGRTSVFDIAERVELPYGEVRGFLDQMAEAGLVTWAPADRFYSRDNPWEALAARELSPGVRQAGS
jgi:aminopeptidase-like protein